jgi:orc1/cdc6 family replication initiation protein
MITDARVLQPEFIPGEVKHRSAEVSHLSDTLRPITQGEPASPSFLYGPSGAGKTCIARHTVEQLRETVVDIDVQYVNCWEDYTRFKTLYRILDGVESTIDIHRQSTPKDELLERLRQHSGPPYVVVLDEVDQLEDKSLLYDLYRMQNLTMILIANREEDVFSRLDDRLNSRLQSCARIRFSQYNLDELTTILEDRVQWGLTDSVISKAQLEAIADAAAGDARVAIGILRNATRVAQQQGTQGVTDAAIEEAVPEAKSEVRQKATDKLTKHQRVLYSIIVESGEINSGSLYERYCESVSEPKTRRMVRNYLSKLEQYNLIQGSGKTKARTYSSVG